MKRNVKNLLKYLSGLSPESGRVKTGTGKNTDTENRGSGVTLQKGSPHLVNFDQERKRKIGGLVQYTRFKASNTQHTIQFDEYRRMCNTFPVIKAAIDIYAEEICNEDSEGNIVSVHSPSKKVKKYLEELIFENLKMNTYGYLVVREMKKMGNVYGYMVIDQKFGVVDIIYLPPETIFKETIPDEHGLYSFPQEWGYRWSGGNMFKDYELVHWKNIEDLESEPYGVSALRSIVDTWRRVVLMREALIIYRITRAPQRLLFKVDTTGLDGEAAEQLVEDQKRAINDKRLVDPETGLIDFTYNPVSIEENLYIPVTDTSNNDVTPLEGASNMADIEDYKIIYDDIFAGLKIPKSFLTFEEGLSNKAALAEEDIRFAKTTQKGQREFLEGLTHICLVHLAVKGCTREEMESFTLKMNNPSIASEVQKQELLKSRLEVANAAWDKDAAGLNLLSYVDVLRDVLKFSDTDIERIIKNQFIEKRLNWKLKKVNDIGFYNEVRKNSKGVLYVPSEENAEEQDNPTDESEEEQGEQQPTQQPQQSPNDEKPSFGFSFGDLVIEGTGVSIKEMLKESKSSSVEQEPINITSLLMKTINSEIDTLLGKPAEAKPTALVARKIKRGLTEELKKLRKKV